MSKSTKAFVLGVVVGVSVHYLYSKASEAA